MKGWWGKTPPYASLEEKASGLRVKRALIGLWILLVLACFSDIVSSVLVAHNVENILAMGYVDRLFETNPSLAPDEMNPVVYLRPKLPLLAGASGLVALAVWKLQAIARSDNLQFQTRLLAFHLLWLALSIHMAGLNNFSLYFLGDSPFHMLRRAIEAAYGAPLARATIYYMNGGIAISLSMGAAALFFVRYPLFRRIPR